MSLSMPLGLLVAGPFAENIGVAQCFLISGLAIMLAAVFGCLLTARLKE